MESPVDKIISELEEQLKQAKEQKKKVKLHQDTLDRKQQLLNKAVKEYNEEYKAAIKELHWTEKVATANGLSNLNQAINMARDEQVKKAAAKKNVPAKVEVEPEHTGGEDIAVEHSEQDQNVVSENYGAEGN